jgi:bifunctional DNA-binding transcriptional regulator/antitoxin component of YhaV-PrlF toxin-antitoxin module
MYAIEFQTTVKEDGYIEIPAEYRQQVQGSTVRVLILTQTPAPKPSIIHQLLENPRRVNDFSPLTRDEIHEQEHSL